MMLHRCSNTSYLFEINCLEDRPQVFGIVHPSHQNVAALIFCGWSGHYPAETWERVNCSQNTRPDLSCAITELDLFFSSWMEGNGFASVVFESPYSVIAASIATFAAVVVPFLVFLAVQFDRQQQRDSTIGVKDEVCHV